MAKRSFESASPLHVAFTGDERVVVLHGKESFLHVEHTRNLRTVIEEKSGGEVETIRIDGEKAPLADVLDELRSYGLMQQHKVVVVTDADEFVKRHREPLERYVQSPEETATLVLRADTWHKGNLDKSIEKVGRIIKCESPNPAEAQSWLSQRAVSQHRVKLDPRAATMMIEQLGVGLGLLDAELGKLAVGVPEGGTVTAEHVQALAGHASDEEAWQIQEALLTGSGGKALAKLHELVDLAGADAVPINWAMSDLMRKLHHAAVMLRDGANAFEICKQLRIWPREREKPFLDAARKFGPARSARLMDMAIEMDRRSKSGYGEGVGPLERFCIQFADALR